MMKQKKFIILLVWGLLLALAIKNINKKINFKLLTADLVPLYPSANLNYYFTFLFLGDPQQKLAILIDIMGSKAFFLCKTENTEENSSNFYLESASSLAKNMNNSNPLSTEQIFFFFSNIQYETQISNEISESEIYLGSLDNIIFMHTYKIFFSCIQKTESLFSELRNNQISGVLGLNPWLNDETIEIEDEFINKIKFGYAMFINKTEGFLKIFSENVNIDFFTMKNMKLIFMGEVFNNEKFGTLNLNIRQIIMENENKAMNENEIFLSFSLSSNYVHLPSKIYEHFFENFQNFCLKNETHYCLGKVFNSQNCFNVENSQNQLILEKFLNSFPKIYLLFNETHNFTLEGKDYLFRLSEDFYCLAIKKNKNLENLIVFGTVFLLNKVFFFARENQQILIFKPENDNFDVEKAFREENSTPLFQKIRSINALAIILPLVFGILCLIALFSYLSSKKRKIPLDQKKIQIISKINMDSETNEKKELEINPSISEPKETLTRLIGENIQTKELETKILSINEGEPTEK